MNLCTYNISASFLIDDDKYGHDFLGEAKFPLNKLKPRITRDLCLNLEKHIPVNTFQLLRDVHMYT